MYVYILLDQDNFSIPSDSLFTIIQLFEFIIWYTGRVLKNTVGSRFATIHFYDLCPIGPSTPDLWRITVATEASFLYLVRF